MSVEVTATYLQPDGVTPCKGRVVFELVSATYHDGLDAIFPTVPYTAVLDVAGGISIDLEPTSGVDADFDATDLTYQVRERINGADRPVYYVDIPSTDCDLGTLATYDDPPTFARHLVDVDLTDLGMARVSRLPLNAKEYGAVGDETTDDTVALQAWLDAGYTQKRACYIPTSNNGQFYKITSALVIHKRGQYIFGDNPMQTIIKQTTAGEHAFTINDDTSNDNPMGTANNGNIRFENLFIKGVGKATSTGYGINAPSDGDWLSLRNMHIRDFDRGVYLSGWAQTSFTDGLINQCNYGAYLDDADSNINTISFRNFGIANSTTAGAVIKSGGGCTVHGGDFVGNPVTWDIRPNAFNQGQTVTIEGGNYESCTGTEWIKCGDNCSVVVIGSQFQITTGNDANPVYLSGGTALVVRPTRGNLTAATIRKASNDLIAQVIQEQTSLSSTGQAIADPGTTVPHAPFPSRADNAVPSAAANYRGLELDEFGRDSAATIDAKHKYIRNRTSGSSAYLRTTLTKIVTGTGSPEGVIAAPPGYLYTREDGGIDTSLYVKYTGTSSTGWKAAVLSGALPYRTSAIPYTMTTSDCVLILTGTPAAGLNSNAPVGTRFIIKNASGGLGSVSGNLCTIDGSASVALANGATAEFISDGTNYVQLR